MSHSHDQKLPAKTPKSLTEQLLNDVRFNSDLAIRTVKPGNTEVFDDAEVTKRVAHNVREGVIQSLRGVVRVDNDLYGIVSVIDQRSYGYKAHSVPGVRTIITRFSKPGDERATLIGITEGNKSRSAGPFSISEQEDGAISVVNDSHKSIEVIKTKPVSQKTKEMPIDPSEAKTTEINPVGEIALGGLHQTVGAQFFELLQKPHDPFSDWRVWGGKSAEVRDALDATDN